MESFKKTIERLKKEKQRLVSEFTKAATGFDAEDFKKLILELITKELVSSTTVKKEVELQLLKPTIKIEGMPHQKKTTASSKSSAPLNRRQSMPAKVTKVPPTKNELTRRQSMPSKEIPKKSPKKTPTRSAMVKNSS